MEWDSAVGGVFDQPSHWKEGNVPGENDTAVFGLTSDYTVTFSADATVSLITIPSATLGTITFDLQGFTWTATSAAQSNQLAFGMSTTPDSSGNKVRLINGTMDILGYMQVGRDGGRTSPAFFEVGNGAHLILRGHNRIGNQQAGTMLITDGAKVETHAVVDVGRSIGNTGMIQVHGEGSQMNFNPAGATARQHLYLAVGDDGRYGRVEVTAGGKITGVNHLDVARGARSSAELLVSGAGSTLDAQFLSVGGRWHVSNGMIRMGTGQVEVGDGGMVHVAARFDVYRDSEVHFNGGGIVAGSSTWQADSDFKLTLRDSSAAPLSVLGDVTLESSGQTGVRLVLDVAEDFAGQIGDVYSVLDYTGSLNGIFNDLEEGSVITVGEGRSFMLSYGSGSDDRVTLTMIPESNSAALVTSLAGACMLLMWRRLR